MCLLWPCALWQTLRAGAGAPAPRRARSAAATPHVPTHPCLHRRLPGTPAGKEMQLLRAKALECVSLVGLAVGKERFG